MATARKPLIIAEKPSAARAIAEALGGFSRREGYLESSEYALSWAIGHLVEQKAPEEYDPRWKRWALETLPIMPAAFDLKVVPRTRAQFDLIALLMRHASELINACDAAREGELIFRYITEMAGATKLPVRRLWVSALTREAIRKAFAELKPQSEYERLYQSALCRSQGDWLVGMNATRAFTVKQGELLSVGRVQTPTLALLVRREREIQAFVPEEYWEVYAEFTTPDGGRYRGKWFDAKVDRLKKAEEAQAIAARVKGQPGAVESAEEKPVAEKPPQLYDLTTLQRDANRRFGLTAAATLKAAQSLYEAKLITYPRTDSRYLSRDLVKGLPAVLRALGAVPEFAGAAAGADPGLVHPGNRRVVDDSKVSDHHAIIPTTERPGGLSAVEGKIYGLIARRFLAQFYPEARYLETEVITRVGGVPDRFRSRGRRVVEQGWRAVEPESPAAARKGGDEAEEPQALPPLRAGEAVRTQAAEAVQKQTQPPRRYTEAALLSAMESAGKEMDDEALKEAMKGRGLGTPATRAAIIERLKEVGYIALEKKALVPTPKGHGLVELLERAGAQVLLSSELTGEWEKRIADIQRGEYQPERFMTEIRQLAVQVVDWARSLGGGPGSGRRSGALDGGDARGAAGGGADLPATAGACPRCGRAVIKGRREWLCAGPSCGLRIPGWLCGKVIDAGLAGQLLTRGRTALITGFKSQRTGKTFSAYLVWQDGRVGFEFPPDKPSRTRRRSAGGTAAAAKTGSRKAGRRTGGGRKAAGSAQPAGARVGGRTSRSSQPARTGAQRD